MQGVENADEMLMLQYHRGSGYLLAYNQTGFDKLSQSTLAEKMFRGHFHTAFSDETFVQVESPSSIKTRVYRYSLFLETMKKRGIGFS